MTARGAGSPARLRQFAHAAGLKEAGALDAIAGDPVTLDLAIRDRGCPPRHSQAGNAVRAPRLRQGLASPCAERAAARSADRHSDAAQRELEDRWLPTAVQISEATLHLGGGAGVWDPWCLPMGRSSGRRGWNFLRVAWQRRSAYAKGESRISKSRCRRTAGDFARCGKEGNTSVDGDCAFDALIDAHMARIPGNGEVDSLGLGPVKLQNQCGCEVSGDVGRNHKP